MQMSMSELRERAAKAKIAYFTGQADRHPFGVSGENQIIPYEFGKGNWDTAPASYKFSEWGNAAGIV